MEKKQPLNESRISSEKENTESNKDVCVTPPDAPIMDPKRDGPEVSPSDERPEPESEQASPGTGSLDPHESADLEREISALEAQIGTDEGAEPSVAETGGLSATKTDDGEIAPSLPRLAEQPFEAAPCELATWRVLDPSLTGYVGALVVPLDIFPEVVADYIRNVARNTGAPEGFVAATLLVMVASAIGHAVRGQAGPEWVVPAILWFVLVGDPSSGKSPAMGRTLRPLYRIEAEVAAAYGGGAATRSVGAARAELLDAAEGMGIDLPGQMPRRADGPAPQLILQGMTAVGVEDAVEANPRGFLNVIDEGKSVLNPKSAEYRALLLNSTEGGPHRRTTGKKHTDLPRVGMWILAAIQPDKLERMLDNLAEDGLGPRFHPIVGEAQLLTEMGEPIDDSPIEELLRGLLALEMVRWPGRARTQDRAVQPRGAGTGVRAQSGQQA